LNKFTIQKSFAISAGAGSGKTYTLSRRYINAILGFDYFREDYDTQDSYFEVLKPARVNEIVTITYTEAAALEMKGRIFLLIGKIIDKNLSTNDSDYNSISQANSALDKTQQAYVQNKLQEAFIDSSNAKISTIHAFCLDIIKSNSDIARIDTKLDIIKEDEKQQWLSQIIFDILNDDKNQEIVIEISKNISTFLLTKLIDRYISSAKFRKDFDSFSQDSISMQDYQSLIEELYPLPEINQALENAIKYIDDAHIDLASQYIEFLEEYVNRFFKFEAKNWSELSKIHGIIIAFNRKPWTKHKEIKKDIDTIKSLDDFTEAYMSIQPQQEELFFAQIDMIKTLLWQIKSRYDQKLSQENKIDFDTIITKTLEIMPQVNTTFNYIMVDEFQDTNAVQFEIVKSACHSKTNLFVVGDSKQSIYSFQGAEIEVFNDATNDKKLFNSIEPMDINHRSDGVVLDIINAIFTPLLQSDQKSKLIKQNYEAQAQDLFVFDQQRKNKGSFKYLITPQPYIPKTQKKIEDEVDELDTIAEFISEIYECKRDEYQHISKLIQKQKKAIAILFDSSTNMLALKNKLKAKGITAKVSTSEDFYETKEINDIFNVLKAIDILSRNPKIVDKSKSQLYYIVGAMRSNIIRCDDNSIKHYLDTDTIPDTLKHYIKLSKTMTLSQIVKYIYDDANIIGVYAHYDDKEQRIANLYKFLKLCIEYETSNNFKLHTFLDMIENAIYFSNTKEEEAFFKSDSTKSIEICSIHSTKGLAYPMILLANSEKALYSQVKSDTLKHNNITLRDKPKEIVGFKVDNYIPLSYRVLKEIDKNKHLAEKKRLLYVALTRAKYDVVISAKLQKTKDDLVSLPTDSYLYMICSSLDINKEELYKLDERYTIALQKQTQQPIAKKSIDYIPHTFKHIEFETNALLSASSLKQTTTFDNELAYIGTTTHKIIECYWDRFKTQQESILDKMMVFSPTTREQIINNMHSFYESDIYNILKDGVPHHFEFEFYVNNKHGFIDLIYLDKEKDGWVIVDFKTGTPTQNKKDTYQQQLAFYQDVMETLGYKIVDSRLLWLGYPNITKRQKQ